MNKLHKAGCLLLIGILISVLTACGAIHETEMDDGQKQTVLEDVLTPTISGNGDNDIIENSQADTQKSTEQPQINQLYAGANASFFIKSDNTLWGWGRFTDFEEEPASVYISTPTKIMENVTVARYFGGGYYIIKSDNSLWFWGYDPKGDIDVDGISPQGVIYPEPIKILDDVADVCGNYGFTLVLKLDGTLWGWGDNYSGQLGNGEIGKHISDPVKIMDTVSSVCAGDGCGFAVKNDGTLWAWGSNVSGQLGNGYQGNAESPTTREPVQNVPVQIMENVVSAYAGLGNFTLALQKDGTLWGWGNNQFGQVGNESNMQSKYNLPIQSFPIRIMEDVVSASAGGFYSFAIKNDGTLWAWGANGFGRLGDGTVEESAIPIKIMENVLYASAGAMHSLAVLNDGTLWAWGSNVDYQLGNGTSDIDAHSIPIKIMDNVF